MGAKDWMVGHGGVMGPEDGYVGGGQEGSLRAGLGECYVECGGGVEPDPGGLVLGARREGARLGVGEVVDDSSLSDGESEVDGTELNVLFLGGWSLAGLPEVDQLSLVGDGRRDHGGWVGGNEFDPEKVVGLRVYSPVARQPTAGERQSFGLDGVVEVFCTVCQCQRSERGGPKRRENKEEFHT